MKTRLQIPGTQLNTCVPGTPARWREEKGGCVGFAGCQTSSSLSSTPCLKVSQTIASPDALLHPPHVYMGMHTHKHVCTYTTYIHSHIHAHTQCTLPHTYKCALMLTHTHTHTRLYLAIFRNSHASHPQPLVQHHYGPSHFRPCKNWLTLGRNERVGSVGSCWAF